MCWNVFAPDFFSTQKLYYAFQPNWQYWKKGKKATSSKGWKDTDEDREQYEQMLERVHSMKPKKDKKGGKKKSKGIKRRLRGQAKGYSKGSTKRVPCLPLFSFLFSGSSKRPTEAAITPKPMPKAKNIAGKGTERASQGMPRAFMDRTRIRAEDAGVAVQESKRPRLMRLGTPYAPRPPIVNINIFGGVGGGSEGASGSGGLLACNVSVFCWSFLAPVLFFLLFWNTCRCGIRPYAAVGDASWPGHGRPAPKAPSSHHANRTGANPRASASRIVG